MAPPAAAVVVLPTPPEPHAMTISLAASSCSMEATGPSPDWAPVGGGAAGACSGRHQYPSSAARASATWRVERRPCVRANRYGT